MPKDTTKHTAKTANKSSTEKHSTDKSDCEGTTCSKPAKSTTAKKPKTATYHPYDTKGDKR